MTKNHERINQLFEELVPASSKAENLAGELVRAMARIGYRWYNDGDQVGIGYGRETCNPAARFLIHKGNKEVSDLAASIWGIHKRRGLRKAHRPSCRGGCRLRRRPPELRTLPTIDIWDLRDPDEDVDDWNEEEEDW